MAHDTHTAGMQGEQAACTYLEGRGYRILDRNYRADRFEIDIIARKSDTVVFCEVKSATTKRFGSPVTWVTPHKIRRIATAAAEYIQENELTGLSFRFDVIGLERRGGELIINHVENAFPVPEDS